MEHASWFSDTGIELKTTDGKVVRIIEFNHQNEPRILAAWAKHFRNHYIADDDLPSAAAAAALSESDYLDQLKFPTKPPLRSGDFSEILVADYLQFALDFIVPRTRYDSRLNKDTSSFGIDIIGFKKQLDRESPDDELIMCESKASLVHKDKNQFQEGVNGSIKDYAQPTRLPEALNAARQRLKEKQKIDQMKLVERFQDATAHPYKKISAAALVCSNGCWDETYITDATTNHPNPNLYLIVLKGESLMDVANNLYKLAHVTT